MRCGSCCGWYEPAVVLEDPPTARVVPREPARRLFFALWPDEAMRRAMVQATREVVREAGGRPIPPSHLHVTLAFLGAVPETRLRELADSVRAVSAVRPPAAGASVPGDRQRAAREGEDAPARRLEIAFDHLEHWRAAQLLCAMPANPPTPVVALARRLRDGLSASGFAPDLKSSWSVGVDLAKPFRPHVTLARKVHRLPCAMEIAPVAWSFADFVLVDSKTLPEGSIYTVLERFPLGG